MKILFIGDLNSYARTYQRYQAMQDLGHQVIGLSTVPIPTIPGIVGDSTLYFRIRYKLGYPPDRCGVNRKIIEMAKRGELNIVWIEKGLMIRAHTLQEVKNINSAIILAFYSEDDMYARHNQSVYFRHCLPLYDVVFTTKSYNLQTLPQIGARRVVFVDKAYDRATHRPLIVNEEDRQRLGSDVIFIGTFEENRAESMLYLAKNGIRVRVWGYGWQKWQNRHPNLIIEGRPIYGDDYVKALCASKIALCFLRQANRDLQTARTMEIPACGVFMLAERTVEHRRLFEEDKEAVYFNHSLELLDKVRYYLEHEEERMAIALAGRKRCLDSGYSHHDRLLFMLQEAMA